MVFESLLERLGEYCERLGERAYQKGIKRAQKYLATNPSLDEIRKRKEELWSDTSMFHGLCMSFGIFERDGEQECLESYLRKIDP